MQAELFSDEKYKFVGTGFLRATIKKYGLEVGDFARFIEDMGVPEDPVGEIKLKNLHRKWEVVSSIQKSIRRGDKYYALRGVSAMLNTGDLEMIRYLWKRITTTAAEDVGLADPYLVAFVLLCSETFTPSKFADIQKPVLYYLTRKMCESVKDRSMCDCAIIESCWVKSENKKAVTALITEEELELVTHVQECEDYEVESPLFKYLATQNWRTEGMGKYFPLVQLIANGKVSSIVVPMTEAEEIVGMPCYAYDMHTQTGKRALGYLLKSPVFADLIGPMNLKDPIKTLGWALFYVEGGLLQEQLEYSDRAGLYNTAVTVSLLNQGVPREKIHDVLMVMADHIGLLNEYRRKIVKVTYG